MFLPSCFRLSWEEVEVREFKGVITVSTRVYILLNVKNGEVKRAVQALQEKDGVKKVEVLEGSPNILMMVQARNRMSLASLANRALASVETITESVQLLPVQNENSSGKQHNKMLIVQGE